MDNELRRLADIVEEGLRGFLANEGVARAPFTRSAAEAVVAARELFTTNDGEPDYLGRSRAYRLWIRERYDAVVPPSERARVQGALRWNISHALREHIGEKALHLGLDQESVAEKGRRRDRRDAHLVSLFSGGNDVTDIDDITAIANAGRQATARIMPPAPGSVPVEDVQIAEEALRRLSTSARDAAARLAATLPVSE